MKRLIYILFSLIPFIGYTQLNWYKSSPLDYMWKNVGNPGFSPGETRFPCLAFSPSGAPYVAFQDFADTLKATVMRFDGSNWVVVGTEGISAYWAYYISLAFSPSDGKPYIAYQDYGNDSKATVMKFDGTNWVNVGNVGFSSEDARFLNLSFSLSGDPYVAFQDVGFIGQGKAIVMKFNGTSWLIVGLADFSAGEIEFPCLAFGPSDSMPYIAYKDFGNSKKVTVMKFDGINWVNVGLVGFSDGEVDDLSIAFSPSGEPYVAYEDWGNSSKATVMKFDGINWINVGNPGFSLENAYFESIAFNPSV